MTTLIASLLAAVLALPAAAAKNLVELLSNGLSLTMTGPQIKKKFGEPTERTFDARTFGYPGFTVNVGGRDQEIWHLTLKRGVTLACGVGVGSSRSEVERAFGSAEQAVTGPYKVFFSYSGGAVSKIRVDPSGGSFAAAADRTAQTPELEPPAARGPGLVGRWHGLAHTIATLELHADGTYSSANGGRGTWKAVPGGAVFTGPLKAWNGGHGTLRGADVLEFEWKDAKGYKYYFALGQDR